jgi:hypothetical protein
LKAMGFVDFVGIDDEVVVGIGVDLHGEVAHLVFGGGMVSFEFACGEDGVFFIWIAERQG